METNSIPLRKARRPASQVFIDLCMSTRLLVASLVLLLLPATLLRAQNNNQAFLPAQVRVVSTIPPNGDLNPYGVATVPQQFPMGATVNPGDILVSNFNNSSNLQGTGTTIVRIQAEGQPLFSSRERLRWG